jgi:hypothetical protein
MHVQMHVDSFAVAAHLESMYSGVTGGKRAINPGL